ncbi:MAG: SUMF1/EgtB/PvdO family nonheme iron enzyme, partial [Fibromonadales bacterium]|nr:SUMF1/EgtB/PvdO family nonheme iron enzyme [Fibromonadales bacterium]
ESVKQIAEQARLDSLAAAEESAKQVAEQARLDSLAAAEESAKQVAEQARLDSLATIEAAKKVAEEVAKQAAAEEKASIAREIEMVLVEGSLFTMGCTNEQGADCNDDERPPQNVRLSNFSVSKYPVTQKLWVKIMGNNPSRSSGPDLPVESVSWNDAQAFIEKLNSMTGRKYRLPTEAEWEYAARGGAKSQRYKHSGGNDLNRVAWFSGNSEQNIQLVGRKQPNELGIHDMNGNVWEWVQDWKGNYDRSALLNNPKGPANGTLRVYRGCSWQSTASICRVSRRNGSSPEYRSPDLGFRLVLDR